MMYDGICDHCGTYAKLWSYGEIHHKDDEFFPKFLCKKCSDEWSTLLREQQFYTEWVVLFKKWMQSSTKEKVSFD